MNNATFRLVFIVFHLTLGAVVFILSLSTMIHAIHQNGIHALPHHLVWLAAAEAIAALLFLVPATLRLGAIVLLIIFMTAIVIHGVHAGLPLLIYGAGVILVMVHGRTY